MIKGRFEQLVKNYEERISKLETRLMVEQSRVDALISSVLRLEKIVKIDKIKEGKDVE